MTIAMTAGRSAELNRVLPPIIETFLNSFKEKMSGKKLENNYSVGTQTDGDDDGGFNNSFGSATKNKLASVVKDFGSMVKTTAVTALRRLSTKEVQDQRANSEKLAKMVKTTLSSLSGSGKKADIKMDPSMLPDSFRGLITSFKINAKNLEKVKGGLDDCLQ